MARRIGITIVWAVLFGCPLLAPAHARAAVTSADLSTPAKALAAFCKALGNGETADLAVVSVGDAKVQDWVCAEAGQLKALKDLETALSNRFGANYAASDKGKEALDRIAEARDDDLHTDLANAPLREIKGDEVILEIDEAKPEDHQGRLVRVGGRWKVDLASLSDYMVPADVPVMKAVAGAAATLARDVTSGKFATIDDAADAIDERLSAAIDAALPNPAPATQESPRGTRPRQAPGSR
jgi:hypothetical protein